MILLFKYLFLSGNKPIYQAIARNMNVRELRVYRLAHGKKAKNNKDYQILKELHKEGVIEGLLRM